MLFFAFLYIVPCILCWEMCNNRNRNPWKGVVLALLFGWFAVLGIWMGLKRRNLKTLVLY